MIIENRDALLKEREYAQKELDSYNCRILVCAGTGCCLLYTSDAADE